MIDRCDITELLVTECAHCRKLPDLTAETPGELGPYFTAKWPGICSGCKEVVLAGNLIRADGTGTGYLGECCGGAG
jgi:hypothetical protein